MLSWSAYHDNDSGSKPSGHAPRDNVVGQGLLSGGLASSWSARCKDNPGSNPSRQALVEKPHLTLDESLG